MVAHEGGRMPILEHFRELRKRVVRAAATIVLASAVGWIFYPKIVNELAKPICDLKRANISGLGQCGSLYIN